MLTQNEVTVNGGGRQYGTKLTAKGAEVLAACIREGTKLEITEIAVGDGGGAYYEPLDNQTALVHEVWRAEVLSCEQSVLNPNTLDIKGVIPSDAGGFVIREMGVFDAAGTLIGVCNTPDMEKANAVSGAGGKLDLIMHLLVTDANAVQVVIKSSLDTVSLKDVQNLLKDKQDVLEGEEGQFVGFDKNGHPLPQALPETGVGRSMAGQTVEPIQGTTVTAREGAEIFNDYRPRTYGPLTEGDTNIVVLSGNVADGTYSHAEGCCTTARSSYSHAEGQRTFADGQGAHAEGWDCVADGHGAHAEGQRTKATVSCAHAEGADTISKHNATHAEGTATTASGDSAHAEGRRTTASGNCAHAEGQGSEATGGLSHAEGMNTIAEGGPYSASHAEGCQTTASGGQSHAEGFESVASGESSHAGGEYTIAASKAQTAIGSANTVSSSENPINKLIVGNGYYSGIDGLHRSNCFRVTHTGVYASGNYNASGADYAELFEWADGNLERQDRAGLFVTLEGERIRLAGPGDGYILGIVSGNPSVVGDVYDDQWQGMYLTDIFGRPIMEDVEVPEVTETVEVPFLREVEGGESVMETRLETRTVIPAHTERRQKLNPDYDRGLTYVPRSARPEWDAVGLLGKLVAVDDGTCQPNGWAAVGQGGTATASPAPTKYRVMSRLDERHVRILIL